MFSDIRRRAMLAGVLLVALVAAGWGYSALASRYDVPPQVAALDAALGAEDWARAGAELAAIRKEWRRARTVFELNFGSELFVDAERALERVAANIAAEEAGAARADLAEFGALWRWLTMAVPDGR